MGCPLAVSYTHLDVYKRQRLERYYTELLVEKESPWIGKSRGEFEKVFSSRLQVVDLSLIHI